MAVDAIERFVSAIGYPERVPDGASSFVLQVDGGEIVASGTGGALRLVCRLTGSASDLPRLTEYATGRLLREDAVLACDKDGAFLWRDVQADADTHVLRRFFETFADSCDWWRARLDSSGGGVAAASPFPEMLIRP